MTTILFLLACFLFGALLVQHRNLMEWKTLARLQENVLGRMRNRYAVVDAKCKCGKPINLKVRTYKYPF